MRLVVRLGLRRLNELIRTAMHRLTSPVCNASKAWLLPTAVRIATIQPDLQMNGGGEGRAELDRLPTAYQQRCVQKCRKPNAAPLAALSSHRLGAAARRRAFLPLAASVLPSSRHPPPGSPSWLAVLGKNEAAREEMKEDGVDGAAPYLARRDDPLCSGSFARGTSSRMPGDARGSLSGSHLLMGWLSVCRFCAYVHALWSASQQATHRHS